MALTKYIKAKDIILRSIKLTILCTMSILLFWSIYYIYFLKEDILSIIITICIAILTVFSVTIIIYYLFNKGYLDGLIESLIDNNLLDAKKFGIDDDKDDISEPLV
jgi:hypothetical protein